MCYQVKELRNRGDETARILLAHLQEGQEPPTSLRRDFEHLMNMVGVGVCRGHIHEVP